MKMVSDIYRNANWRIAQPSVHPLTSHRIHSIAMEQAVQPLAGSTCEGLLFLFHDAREQQPARDPSGINSLNKGDPAGKSADLFPLQRQQQKKQKPQDSP